ncbi:MAG TPA: hypothetical protein DCZ59_01985 [Bacteroidetes bacterium]|nr:hypothetical protein [Bacteroidota bacterium]
MNTAERFIGVAIMVFMIATSSVFGQTYLGLTIGSTVAGSSRSDVSAYGEPSRVFYGGRVVTTLRKGLELVGTFGLRQEEGGFTSRFARSTFPGGGGTLQVVENPISGPVVVSSLSTSALELSAALRIPMARFDSAGSYIGLQLGAMADYLSSADQVDDYTRILQGDRGQIPDRVSTSYASQVGGGAQVGGLLVLQTDLGRLSIEFAYLLRRPETLPVPAPRVGGPKEQYVGWLVGNGLRISAGLELKL